MRSESILIQSLDSIQLSFYIQVRHTFLHACVLLYSFILSGRTAFLAHLWGAYAVPLALCVVRHVSSVSTITTRNNEAIKSIFSANVYNVPGLCLQRIDGAPYIIHKIMVVCSNYGEILPKGILAGL